MTSGDKYLAPDAHPCLVALLSRVARTSLEDQLVDLTVSVEAVGLKSVVREHVDGVANDQRTIDGAVGLGGCKAADLGESIRVGSQ